MLRRFNTAHPPTIERKPSPTRPAIGLVLSGGGARGFAHIGLLRVLERHGIEPDVMAGTSMGAILGALYAHGYRADDLHEIAASISWRDLIDISLTGTWINVDKLHDLLTLYLPERFEELGKPLAVTCTDIEAAEEIVFSEGDLILAVRASACFPGAFEPVEYGGRTLADGAILNNLPVDALTLMRAGVTLASDVSPPRRAVYVAAEGDRKSWWQRMVAALSLERRSPMDAVQIRAADIMMRLLTDAQYLHHPADVRVQHEMPDIHTESFAALDEIVARGEAHTEAAFRAQPDLLGRLQAASGPPMRRRPLPKRGPSRSPVVVPEAADDAPDDTAPDDTAAPTAAQPDDASADEHPMRALWSHLRRG